MRLQRWDMHVHTRWSDGSMPVEDVVSYAHRIGLSGIAVTDHDAMDMVPAAQREAEKVGLEIIPGVELSSIDNDTGRKVHILVYYPQNLSAITPLFDDITNKRRAAGEKMIELMQKQYPITREMVLQQACKSKTLYRVHLMRALVEMGFSLTIYGKLYVELFGDEGSCYVPVMYNDVFDVAKAARDSGGVVVLAHPDVYDSFEIGEKLAESSLIDGIEYNYPRKKAQSGEKHDRLVQKYELLKTGGTDYHGYYTTFANPLGSCTASADELEKIKELALKRRKDVL